MVRILSKEVLKIKEFDKETDLGRLAELWGNLCMVQQMRGEKFWMDQFNQSGLSWQDFLISLSEMEVSKLLVFLYQDIVCGFTFFILNEDLASIKEFYIEPGYQEKFEIQDLIQDIKAELKKSKVEFVEFDVKDLGV